MTPELRDDEAFALLDAYLDDELTPAERRSVDALLERSAAARAELADIDRVRSLVRGLPPVDAPFGFYERLTRRRRRRAPGVVFASFGAVAAAIALIVAVTPVIDRVAPPVEDLAQRHAMLASSTAEMPDGYEPMSTEEMDDEAAPPASADGYARQAAYDAPDGMHVVYALGTTRVSVFEQRGELAWNELPDGGERMMIGDERAWAMGMAASGAGEGPATTTFVTVVDRDGVVVTVVGSVSPSDASRIAEAMPAPPGPSMVDRIEDACTWVAEGFGFPG